MRLVIATALMMLLWGCETGPSERWVQEGRTDAQAKSDYAQCEKDALHESNGMRSTDPFKEGIMIRNCMQKMGYQSQKQTAPR
jgi:hypothetical protein